MIDRVVLMHQLEGFLVVEVRSLPLHLQVRAGQERDRLSAAIASLLAPRHPPLRRLERPLSFTIPTRVEDVLAARQGGEGLQAQVYARFLARWWKRVHWRVRTGEADIVAVRFPLMVTVLGVPSIGRLQRTAMRPIFESARKPLSS